MYLHMLRMSAVGPFVGNEQIDFAQLSAAKLFLLEGPTGVGKSTIIDAIVYALYGSVAGASSSVERMRSEFAGPDTPTSVELTFETNTGIFRVVRTPPYRRIKLRGEGVVAQPATVKLFRLGTPDSTAGQLISGRHEEVNAEIVRAIGLTKIQFTQTIVLPQGEFAEFLKAKPEERREVLQRIFGTQLYENINEQLQLGRQQALRQREEAKRAIEDELHLLAEVADCSVEESEELGDATGSSRFEGTVVLVRDRVGRANEAAVRSLAIAQRVFAEADSELKLAEQRGLLFLRRDELLAERKELSDQQSAIAGLRVRLSELKAAATCGDVLAKLQGARVSYNAKRDDLDRRAEQLRSAPLTSAGVDKPDVVARALREDAARLDSAVACENSLPEARRAIGDLEGRRVDCSTSLAGVESALAEIPRRSSELNQQLASQRTAEARLPDLERKVSDLHTRSLAAAAAVAALATLDELEAGLTDGHTRVTAAANRVKSATDRWIGGIAGQLAVELEAGMPCLVCGSKDHPEPAVPSSAPVTRNDVDGAMADHAAAVEHLSELHSSYNEVKSGQRQFVAKAAGADPSTARAEYAQAIEELAALADAASSVAATEQQLADLSQLSDAKNQQQDQLRARLSALTERLETARRQLSQDESAVTLGRGDWPTVSDRVSALTAAADGVEEFAAMLTEAHAAKQLLAEREQDFSQVLARSALESERDIELLVPELAGLPALEERIGDYDLRLATNAKQLSAPALAALEESARPEIPPLAEQLARADEYLREATEVAIHSRKQLAVTESHAAELLTRHRFRTETFASTAPILRVAEVASANSADNLQRITLAAFVLIDRFQRVLDAANTHLKHISDGQYQLERSEQPESNGRKSGLGLNMRDEHTGHLRSPRDLSGGETFYTSLALALGLADIVMSETGGIELGTLFIDEGFGTLDPQRLEAVLSEIAKQQNSGRVVGVVSHVEDLKIRIPHRVSVRRTATGSSTLTVVGH